ncbi:hypothetical protein BDK51DRAFT_50184 [Blyttiomyces helicus]|uniref:Uncharacterized protein n=1 Tax=Blyttiomyces helicus TaxID=388810 RepID=A0A4P9W2Q7_9FUNG|nr:hypothetical protein BDK51DRAFT_50184 [Blyttiomyces helicus]|eukprot:RKO85665.1 hypothetical protein BDK51DRAFT_50184 [Blyttiomyces helicus]
MQLVFLDEGHHGMLLPIIMAVYQVPWCLRMGLQRPASMVLRFKSAWASPESSRGFNSTPLDSTLLSARPPDPIPWYPDTLAPWYHLPAGPPCLPLTMFGAGGAAFPYLHKLPPSSTKPTQTPGPAAKLPHLTSSSINPLTTSIMPSTPSVTNERKDLDLEPLSPSLRPPVRTACAAAVRSREAIAREAQPTRGPRAPGSQRREDLLEELPTFGGGRAPGVTRLLVRLIQLPPPDPTSADSFSTSPLPISSARQP